MNTVFIPAIRVMNHLRYPQKFLLIGILLLLPLLLLLSQYISATNAVIDFASKERLGLVYTGPLVKLYNDLLRQWSGQGEVGSTAENANPLQTISADVDQVNAVDAQLGVTLSVHSQWLALQSQAQTASANADRDVRYAALSRALRLLIIQVGNNSNLILDSDIDTYYLMDNLINKLPELADQVTTISTSAGTRILGQSDRARLTILSSMARFSLESSQRSYNYALNYNPALNTQLQAGVSSYVQTISAALDRIDSFNTLLANPANASVSGASVQTTVPQAIDAVFTLYRQTMPLLDQLLQARIDRNANQRVLVISFALLMLTLTIYVFIGFYLAVRQTIEQLDHATRRMVTGSGETFHLDNRDELAQVAISFNTIASELLTARDQALESNRAKSTFLATMSHELRTPLNAIIGYSELIQEECEDSGQDNYIPDLQKIQMAAKHLMSLINDILDLSKIEAGKMDLFLEVIDVGKMISEIETTVLPLVQKNGNQLIIEVDPAVGMMRADLTKIRQVLFNLLSNASKFTKQGTIRLSAQREAVGDGDWMVFRVVDSGIGMTAEQIGKLFRDFSQADASTTRKYGGTGLGLSISRRFCQMLGGDITVESMFGSGSTFIVRLPAAVTKQEPVSSIESTRSAVPTGARTVLVIDDDASTRDLITRFLLREGYYVEAASGGVDGLQRARDILPDVIMLDVMMPGMDGWAVLSALKADSRLTAIPVVMISIAGDKNMGYALGAVDYLPKPIQREQLMAIVSKYRRDHKGQYTVLLVEDDTNTREMFRRALEKEQVTVIEAADGLIGLAQIARTMPNLVLLDLMMPNMNGFEFVAELRKSERGRGVPVVVVTAMELSSGDRDRLNGQVEAVVQKGLYSGDKLFAELRTIVGQYAEQSRNGAKVVEKTTASRRQGE